jgi:hypothetical protein
MLALSVTYSLSSARVRQRRAGALLVASIVALAAIGVEDLTYPTAATLPGFLGGGRLYSLEPTRAEL